MAKGKPGHQVTLLSGGHEFFPALQRAIEQAHTEVRLETYIFRWDGVGEPLAQALEAAALRGVRVCLTVDGLGTPEWPAAWVERFERAGVAMQVYAPLRWFSPLYPGHWHRLHRKLVVVDRELAFCGGHNIMDDFWDTHLGDMAQPRMDFSVAVRGPLVREVHEAMCRLWWTGQAWQNVRSRDFDAAWQDLRARWQTRRPERVAPTPAATDTATAPSLVASLLLRDSVQHRAVIERAYLRALANARQDVLLANAYFIPGYRLLKALLRARSRGVRVTLLLQGRYESFMQFHAGRAVYARLLAAGVEIVTYTASQFHGKVAVIDGSWATVGSSNLDPLSLLMAREANVVVLDGGFAHLLTEHLQRAMEDGGIRLQAEQFARRRWYSRCADALALGLMRVLLVLAGQRYR